MSQDKCGRHLRATNPATGNVAILTVVDMCGQVRGGGDGRVGGWVDLWVGGWAEVALDAGLSREAEGGRVLQGGLRQTSLTQALAAGPSAVLAIQSIALAVPLGQGTTTQLHSAVAGYVARTQQPPPCRPPPAAGRGGYRPCGLQRTGWRWCRGARRAHDAQLGMGVRWHLMLAWVHPAVHGKKRPSMRTRVLRVPARTLLHAPAV